MNNSIAKTIFLTTLLLTIDATHAGLQKFKVSPETIMDAQKRERALRRRSDHKELRSLYRSLWTNIKESKQLTHGVNTANEAISLIRKNIAAQKRAGQDFSGLEKSKQTLNGYIKEQKRLLDKAHDAEEKNAAYIDLARETRGLPCLEYYDDAHVRQEAQREL